MAVGKDILFTTAKLVLNADTCAASKAGSYTPLAMAFSRPHCALLRWAFLRTPRNASAHLFPPHRVLPSALRSDMLPLTPRF